MLANRNLEFSARFAQIQIQPLVKIKPAETKFKSFTQGVD
jgi:hypothetical protein